MTKMKLTSPLKWVMFGELLILISLLLIAWALENFDFYHPDSPKPSHTQTESTLNEWQEPTVPTTTTQPVAPTEPFITDISDPMHIATPYGVLMFPDRYGDCLHALLLDEPYGIQYIADFGDGRIQQLFAVRFGGNGGRPVGFVNGVPVYVDIFTVTGDWTEEQLQTIYAMQEEMNSVLTGIPYDVPQNPEDFLPTDDGKTLWIDTPYGKLHYPSRWKTYLVLSVEDGAVYSVRFACKTETHGNQPLFVVYFGGNQGMMAGAIQDANGKSTVVRVEIFDFLPNGTWTYEEKSIVVAMQEDLNYLIQQLFDK